MNKICMKYYLCLSRGLQMQADLNARNVSSFYVYPGSQCAHVSREYVPFTAQAQVEVIY